jgi:carbon starvation protein
LLGVVVNPVLASFLYEEEGPRILLRAMPIMLCVLGILAVAYRYYSAFLAAKVAALDDSRPTPAHVYNDGQNYDPTNKWVLFGHHFAAISGAGPLIGPVLAIQYGYMPGLLWLVAGVCLAGAVQDMLVMAASVRRGGKSLAEIARTELGPRAAILVSVAILFIVIIALAGLGIVVVKALGGESVILAPSTRVLLAPGTLPHARPGDAGLYEIPERAKVLHPGQSAEEAVEWGNAFMLRVPASGDLPPDQDGRIDVPAGTELIIAGSSWGMFTIACTIPIALFVGLYMYRIRKGKVVEASIIGAVAVLAATVAGSWIPDSPLRGFFSLSRGQTTLALTGYGFVAAVLPVWLLLCPRDYLSSFLKIGTIALLVVGLLIANPVLKAPPINTEFLEGGPTFKGPLFPFVFICIMCGAISGFHALVASGTTPKMIDRESHIRTIGYGAMLMEGLVGVVALLAAASLDPVRQYYKINVPITEEGRYEAELRRLDATLRADPMHRAAVLDPHQLPVADRDLAELERLVGGESLRGRTGGAVTLAVGMAVIFTDALHRVGIAIEGFVKYWYHFAIMFEALFILTTIDAGTRIARFLLQEALGKVVPKFERTDWLPGALLTTLLVTAGWGILVQSGSISTIWPMFGIANQLLAVMALGLVTTLLVNSGRARYAPVTLAPMLFVTATTMTAAAQLVGIQFPDMIRSGKVLTGWLNIGLTLFVVLCVLLLLLMAVARWIAALAGMNPPKPVRVGEP